MCGGIFFLFVLGFVFVFFGFFFVLLWFFCVLFVCFLIFYSFFILHSASIQDAMGEEKNQSSSPQQ